MVIRYAYAMVVKHGSKGSTNVAGSMVGRTFNNRYTLTERVGLGGMAEVYRAQDNVLGRTVAVKVMLPQYAADPTFTKRFRQEAASAANLQSPYIVSIYDWGLDGETYYIVMEFLRGTDLKTAINERGAINQRKAAEIGSQIAQALSVAHEGGVMHCPLRIARAGSGQGAHRRQRYLLVGRSPLRSHHRKASLRRPRRGKRCREAGQRASRTA